MPLDPEAPSGQTAPSRGCATCNSQEAPFRVKVAAQRRRSGSSQDFDQIAGLQVTLCASCAVETYDAAETIILRAQGR